MGWDDLKNRKTIDSQKPRKKNKYDTKENHQTTKGKQRNRKGQRRNIKSMGKQS